MKLYATVACYGNKKSEEILEVRLAIHDAWENIIHTEYWNVEDQLTEVEVTDDIIKTCERFEVDNIFSVNTILELKEEYCDECKGRIFRTIKPKDAIRETEI